MKSKKIDLTESFDDCDMVIGLASFLMSLSIKSGQELHEEILELREAQFCGDCQNPVDDCGCNGRYRAEYDDGADYEI